MRNYVVMAVEYPLYELITHDLLQALPILKRPGIPEASFHCLASYFIAARPKRPSASDLEPGMGSSRVGLQSANYFDPSAASAAPSNARSSLSFNFASSSLA